MLNIFKNDFDLFKYAFSRLAIGQIVRITGKDHLNIQHTIETFVVKAVSETEILTTTGLVFHYTNITHMGYTEEFINREELPHKNLTGQLETFESEPE
ncbi:hypothetical protein A2572_04260 [Candidatus Collierbacteria bacterium RIFOXYD1_FULL_40_9]|uniref:Uncharacterized protein n=1 Tax=Candidatus Collierbacteria bacterium RIFOXYD1_FULL_40_9 TaxID=1817731 RepID=A0A1F5FPN1_9BACT|nr:MAG: hypothetical protein A2572_04260 [Candidatus Collierbacteria bacterium RIFOXYD1_FULL_40_9]